MAEHVSALVLDELAAGTTVGAEPRAHVDGCPACGERLRATLAARAAAKSAPEFEPASARFSSASTSRGRNVKLLNAEASVDLHSSSVRSPSRPGVRAWPRLKTT